MYAYLFEGLYPFAGQVRTGTISKGGFMFANGDFLPQILPVVDNMPEDAFDHIVGMNVVTNLP